MSAELGPRTGGADPRAGTPEPPVVRLASRSPHCRIEIRGEFDLATGQVLADQLRGLLGGAVGPVVLDVAGTFFDLVGMQALLGAVDRLPAIDRPVRVIGATTGFARVLAVADPAGVRLQLGAEAPPHQRAAPGSGG